MRTRCTFCGGDGPRCPAFKAHLGEHHCDRPAGHDGSHVCCGTRHEDFTWSPNIDDIARDLAIRVSHLGAAITRCRTLLEAYAQSSHEDYCDGDTPCPRDVAEEALATLEISA